MTTIKIIGIGNPFRRDDSVGLAAARRLRETCSGAVVVEEASGEGGDLMERWRGCDRVILIDAVRSGARPGTIHRLDASSGPIPKAFFSYSTHAFSVAEAVELARALGRLPRELVIFGIEGLDFSTGEGLTPPVEEALEEVVDNIRHQTSDAKPGERSIRDDVRPSRTLPIPIR